MLRYRTAGRGFVMESDVRERAANRSAMRGVQKEPGRTVRVWVGARMIGARGGRPDGSCETRSGAGSACHAGR